MSSPTIQGNDCEMAVVQRRAIVADYSIEAALFF